ncbi:DUF6325 family protein [Streptacidiphilus fuscans]|uniref:DUF1269 domain-containing protein n=1 Tax=Streptacidiphilus fuscans TaxID=2789292 RepID=A0A931B8P4_9ACTN|nr:DUF6325 family protein [Streptacidiphilus fuscans]MBF9073270.1 hypothetical protein [Streptacidiphilus fuscans]
MGPVEFLVLAFPGEQIGPDVVAPLGALRRAGGVRLIDSLVVTKAGDGTISASELIDHEHLRAVLPKSGAAGHTGDLVNLMGEEDAAEAAELLEPGSCALLLLVEHVWAAEAAEAFRAANGRVAASVRIPPEHVAEARQALAKAEG